MTLEKRGNNSEAAKEETTMRLQRGDNIEVGKGATTLRLQIRKVIINSGVGNKKHTTLRLNIRERQQL